MTTIPSQPRITGRMRVILPIFAMLLAIAVGVATVGVPSRYQPYLVAAPILLLCCLVIVTRPSWGLVALLLLFYNPVVAYTRLAISEWSYVATFGILGLMLLPLAIRFGKTAPLPRYPAWWRRIYLALFAFGLAIVFGAFYGLLRGNSPRYVISDSAQMIEFIIVFWLTTLVLWRTAKVNRVITVVFGVFLVTVAWELVLYFRGSPISFADTLDSTEGLLAGTVGGTMISRGLSAAPAVFLPVFVAVLLIAGKRLTVRQRLAIFVASALAVINIILSFSRTVWVAQIAALLLVPLLARKTVGMTRVARSTLRFILLGVLVIVAASAISLHGTPILELVGSRVQYTVSQLTAGENIGRDSRLYEYEVVWQSFQDSPVLGTGLGAEYVGFHRGVFEQKHYLHSTYLAIVFRLGLTGFLSFVYCLGMIVTLIWSKLQSTRDPFRQALIVGSLASVANLAFQALAQGTLFSHPLSAYAGFLLGLAVYLATDQRCQRHDHNALRSPEPAVPLERQ